MVARNFRTPRCRGEVDLIGWESDVLCFVEVKTRTTRVSSLVRNVPMLNSLEMSPFSIFMTLDFHDVALGRGVMLCLWPSPERSPFRAKRRGRPETKLACSSARRPTEPPSRGPSLSIFPAMDGPASDARGGTLNFSPQRRCES